MVSTCKKGRNMNHTFCLPIILALLSASAHAMQQVEMRSEQACKTAAEIQLQTVEKTVRQAIKDLGNRKRAASHWMPSWRALQPNPLDDILPKKGTMTVVCVGLENQGLGDWNAQGAVEKKVTLTPLNEARAGTVDLLVAYHSLYDEMESIFKASEALLNKKQPIEKHPLFNYFSFLSKNGIFEVTLKSGPDIQDFTNVMLGKHNLELSLVNRTELPSLKIFNTAETFFRCLDIFKSHYEEKTGKSIMVDVSYRLHHTSLEAFCSQYIQQYPELATMKPEELEKFLRLICVFNIGNDIIDLDITCTISVQDTSVQEKRSFMPIGLDFSLRKATLENESNEISLGQQNLDKQIQNLEGSEVSMNYIKDADGAAQFKALSSVIGRKKITCVDFGGGRGETNAVMNALRESGSPVRLLNIEPHKPFEQPYIQAHTVLGIEDVQVWQKTAQEVAASDIIKHFNNKKVDVAFASHSFYFLLPALHKASQESAYGDSTMPLEQHPLWKYIDILDDKGVLVLTMQSGAGARLFRNALLGNHGLNKPSSAGDETVSLLSSFGNMATLLRHFELFAERYHKKSGKTMSVKMHHSVANVPLGGIEVMHDPEMQSFVLKGVQTGDASSASLAKRMLDFYGNWTEQQTLAMLTPEKVEKMPIESRKKLGLENPTPELIAAKKEMARRTQETFLRILRIFAPALVNMQHPNITLEIRVQA